MTGIDDPRGELALLGAALRRHLRRERDRGRLRLPLAPAAPESAALESATAEPAGAAPNSTAAATGAAEPGRSAAPPAKAPAATPPSGATSSAPRSADPDPAALDPAMAAAPSAPATAAAARDAADLDSLRATVAGCTACGLCETRTQTVFADGDPGAKVMFVGEAPGADEDAQGVPFVGRAGQLLTDIITKGMGLARGDVYIANVLKCRPPGNRDPQPAEKRLCTPYLQRQIDLVDPQVLIPLGRHAANHLLSADSPMGRLRGRVHRLDGRAVVPTYHPAFLLRSPSMKRAAWEDIQLAMAEIGLPIPDRGRTPDPGRG